MTAEPLVVGKRLPRVDAIDKVTGAAKYTGDHHAARACCTQPCSAARTPTPASSASTPAGPSACRGVKASSRASTCRACATPASPNRAPARSSRTSTSWTDTVRFHGDGVAAVAAASPEACRGSAGAHPRSNTRCCPPYSTAYEAMQDGAPRIHGTERNLVIPPVRHRSGATWRRASPRPTVFSKASTSRRATCLRSWSRTSAPSVPDAAGRLTVYSSTQAPFMVRGTLSEVLGIPMSKIRVITEHMGGGFGAKQDLYQHEYLAALLALRTGRPVRVRVLPRGNVHRRPLAAPGDRRAEAGRQEGRHPDRPPGALHRQLRRLRLARAGHHLGRARRRSVRCTAARTCTSKGCACTPTRRSPAPSGATARRRRTSPSKRRWT